jgi:hypothetical protein
VRHGFHDVLLADPMEAAGVAKAVGAARNMMYDAVHMKPAGYAALAGKIRDLILQWMLAKKRKGGSIEQPAGSEPGQTLGSAAGAVPAAAPSRRKEGRARRGAAGRAGERPRPDPDKSCKCTAANRSGLFAWCYRLDLKGN